jgi:hypothetical protein
MKTPKRAKDTRLVAFKEDYTVGKDKKVIYKKGEQHAIHHKTVKILEDSGAKLEAKKLDYEAEIEKIKKAREKAADKDKAKENN